MTTYKSRTPKKYENDPYSNLKNELNHETSVFINEKDSGNRSYYDDEKEISVVNTAYSSNRKRQYRDKINDTVKLVETDKNEAKSQYKNKIGAEKEIYDLLKQTGPQRQRKQYKQYRRDLQNPEKIQLKQQNYKYNQQSSQNYDDSKYNLKSGNNQRSNQRVEDMLGDDFTVQDLDFLRGLSKDELIKKLLNALRLYKAQKNKRIWIENQLRRILGVETLPNNLENYFGGNQQLYSPMKKRGVYKPPSKEHQQNDLSLYGGISQYENLSPKKSQNINRNIYNDYNDSKPVTLNSVNKSYERQRDYKPLRSGANQPSQDKTPTYRRNYQPKQALISTKNISTQNKNQNGRISFNPEYQKLFEKNQSNNYSPEPASVKNYSYVSDKKSPDTYSQYQSKSTTGGRLKRLYTISGNHPDMHDIWEQGETIRKETVTLVSNKKQGSQYSKNESKYKKQYQRPVYREVIQQSNMKQSIDDLSDLPIEEKKRKIQAITRATYN